MSSEERQITLVVEGVVAAAFIPGLMTPNERVDWRLMLQDGRIVSGWIEVKDLDEQ